MMFSGTIYPICALLSLLHVLLSVSAIKPGLELVNPPRGSESECLDSELTFQCTSTGKGSTELIFEGFSEPLNPFEFRHSRYMPDSPNRDDNDDRLDGEVRVGNLSRSDSEECFDSRHNTSHCYTTSLIVRLTNRTLCGVIVCRTVFRPPTALDDEIIEIGRADITRTPPPPTNLSLTARSPEELAITWEAGTSVNCPAVTYEVTTSNCGSCSPTITTDRYVTCKNPVAGQVCNVSVRSMLECGVYSNASTLEDIVPEANPVSAEANPTSTDNRAAIGIGVGVGVGVPVLLIVGAIVGVTVMIILCNRRKSSNRVEFKQVTEATPTPSHGGSEAPVVQVAESSLNGTKVVSEHREENVSADQKPLLNSSLIDPKVDPENSVGDISVIEKQPVPPSDSVTSKAISETHASLVNDVAPEPEETTTSSKAGEGELFSGSKAANLPKILIDKLADPAAALIPGIKSVGVSSQHEDTNPANARDVPVQMMVGESLQTFSTSVENGKKSTNAEAVPSLVTQNEHLVPNNGQEPPNNSGGEAAAKKPVALQSGSEDGPSQTVAINGKGAQNFANVHIARIGSEDAPDVLTKFDKRITDLEIKACKATREREEATREREELKIANKEKTDEVKANKEKIVQLTAEISDLRQQLKTMKAKHEKESEDERQRHKQEEDKLNKKIKGLEEELMAANARIKELEDENATLKIPKKSLSTDASGPETRPEFQRSKSSHY